MSFQVNQNFNPYNKQPQQQVAMGIGGTQGQPIGETVREGINSNTAIKGATDPKEKNKWITLVALVPIWAGMIKAMEKFNKECSGRDGKDLITKVSDWGEKVGNNKFFQSSFMKNVENKTTWLKTKFFENIVPKSRVLNAIFNTPTRPESHMVLMMAGGTKSEVAADAAQKLEQYQKEHPTDFFKHIGYEGREEEFKKICGQSHDNIEAISEMCEKLSKVNDHFVVSKSMKLPFTKETYLSEIIPGNLGHKVLDTNVHFSSYVNKLKAFNNGKSTWLGKNLPKAMLRTIEGITNGTAGGNIAILMAAFFIAEAVKDAFNAPKGDKVSTFAESNINGLGFYLLMPFTIGLMHKAGGLKFMGMSADQVKAYREKITAFNERTEHLASIDTPEAKNLWKQEKEVFKNEIKAMLKCETVDPQVPKIAINGNGVTKFLKKALYAPFKAAANIITVGLENAHGFYKKDAGFFEKLWKSPIGQLKKAAGYPVRFSLILFLIAPPFVNFVTKCGHVIFGRPKKSILDKEQETEKTKEHPPLIYPNYATPDAKPATQAMQAVNNNSNLNYNLVQKKQAGMIPTEEPEKRRYIPSDENVIARQQHNLVNMYSAPKKEMISDAKPANKAHDKYNYVPSDTGVKQKYDDSAELEKYRKQIEKSDNAIKLAGKYSGHKDKG